MGNAIAQRLQNVVNSIFIEGRPPMAFCWSSWQGGTTPLDFCPNLCHYTIMENKATDMATPIFSLIPSEQQAKWDYVMGQMLSFVDDTNADIDMAYDFVCEQLGIDSFVDNNTAWDDFYNTWEAADNRNQTQYNFAW